MEGMSAAEGDYEDLCRNFSITVPRYYNFGYDVIDSWAQKDRNKLAMIWVNQEGCEKKYSFRDLKNLSNQAANILIKYGIQKGDRVLLIMPRIPEWWVFMIALIKLGAVVCPCPTMLTPKDIRYRLNAGKFKMVITLMEHVEKVNEVADDCPSLMCRFLVDGELPGWISYPLELHYPAPVSHHSVSMPVEKKTLSSDPMLIYFTSGTTGEPKMVLHDHSYPLGHLVTAGLWQDLTPTMSTSRTRTPGGQSVPGVKSLASGYSEHACSSTMQGVSSRQPSSSR